MGEMKIRGKKIRPIIQPPKSPELRKRLIKKQMAEMIAKWLNTSERNNIVHVSQKPGRYSL
jgi:hypothetical protein